MMCAKNLLENRAMVRSETKRTWDQSVNCCTCYGKEKKKMWISSFKGFKDFKKGSDMIHCMLEKA